MTTGGDVHSLRASAWSATRKLGFRFAIVLAAALLPLGIAALFQTRNLQIEVQGRTEAALLGETISAASAEIGTIRKVQGIVAAMAQVVPLVSGDDAACSTLMRATAAQIPSATHLAYVPKNGQMTCSSAGRIYDFSDSPQFEAVRAAETPGFMVNRNGPISGTSILGVSHPVFDGGGAYLGYVTMSLPHSALIGQSQTAPDAALGDLLYYWTFDKDGEILTSFSGLDDVMLRLPANQSLDSLIGQPARVFQDISVAGFQRTYAVVPLVPGELYLMSNWNIQPPSFLYRYGIALYLPPIIMWAVGLVVAAWAAEQLVTRHIRVLSKSIGSFAKGDRRMQPLDLRDAPIELQQVGDAYQRMTENILLSEALLEDSIYQKEVLLREVHHRVKNNLQLIASIMNMQMRKAIAPEAKSLLKGLQDRVLGLATIHRELYQTSGLADVRADELFTQIVRQIANLASGPEKRFDLHLDVDELRLTPDQAVPLSLLLTEAMTNAIKYAGARPGETVRIEVRLKRQGDSAALLEVTNTLNIADDSAGSLAEHSVTEEARANSTGLGKQLLTAFAQQVGGTLDQRIEQHSYRVSLQFDVTTLADAEQQSEPGQTDISPEVP